MNPLFTALSQGYSTSQVLNFLLNANPKLKNPINAAKTAGYTADQIIKFLSDKEENKAAKAYLTSNEIHAEKKKEYREKVIQGLKVAGSAGLAAASAYALSRVIPPALQAAQAALGGQAPTGPNPPASPQSPQGIPPQAGAPTGQLPQGPAPISPQAPQPNNPVVQGVSPQIPLSPTPTIPASQILSQMGMQDKVDIMRKAGNTPEAIAAALNMQLTGGQRKWFGEQLKEGKVKPLQPMIEEYFKEVPEVQAPTPTTPTPNSPTSAALQFPKAAGVPPSTVEVPLKTAEVEEKPISKGVLVASPKGIGQVKEIRGDQALVDIDGKIHKEQVDQVMEQPEGLAEAYENLINKIPESERSAMINFAGYDPTYNELAFKPHAGAVYVYKDIPEEFAQKLKDAMFQAKTSGQTYHGAWTEGEASRGAGLSVLIKDLQKLYGGKGKEYIRKYETVHDFLALPEAAIKDKKRKQREEAKRKKIAGG